MTHRHLRLAALAAILLLPSSLALARTRVDTTDILYRLTAGSTLVQSCSAICGCAEKFTDSLIGTFRLTPGPPDPLFRIYNVDQVSWLSSSTGLGYWVTGSGTYRVSRDFPTMQQLSLDLRVGDRPVMHFDSGLVPGGAGFPAIDPLTLKESVTTCHTVVLALGATPVDPIEIATYSSFGSSSQEGCFGPCLCTITSKPILGTFGLLELASDEAGADFGVVNVGWIVRDATGVPSTSSTPVTGAGIYHVGTLTHDQRLRLALIEGGVGPTRFDSGIMPWDGNLHRIDIEAAENGFACYDHVYALHAQRRRRATGRFQGLGLKPMSPVIAPTP
jgi:hypothetical protein